MLTLRVPKRESDIYKELKELRVNNYNNVSETWLYYFFQSNICMCKVFATVHSKYTYSQVIDVTDIDDILG